ncbi:MAG: CBS domain-containing protein [Gammaproteobacteria bacterium]|nr:CBS domain-containing protein [Gammaproteobacteria bacterium]
MTAGEYCNREVVITDRDTSIAQAAILMREHHVGSLVVVKKRDGANVPIGIVTDRDLVIEVIALKVPINSVIVGDIMSTDLVTVEEQETLINTLDLMLKKGVRRIPVVDKQKNLQGILTADDAIDLLAESMSDLTKIINKELMYEIKQRP